MECLASDVTQVVVCGGFFQKQGVVADVDEGIGAAEKAPASSLARHRVLFVRRYTNGY